MASSLDDVLESILNKKLDKQDALRTFGALSDVEKISIVERLKSKLLSDDAPRRGGAGKSAQATLKAVHESKLSDEQKRYTEELSAAFAQRVPASKRNALVHQAHFVDQRKVAGLKRPIKSMQFQLTYARAEGAYLYDVDGNKYVDITGDNGVNFFGHQPEFMKKALIDRLHQGYPLVAYSEDLFEAAELFCEITGHERMVFAQSGTEAVMWALRIARAATGKKKVVIFDGAYHGLSDNVLAFKSPDGSSMSAGLGMLQEFADQLIILDYGDMDQLATIEARAHEIACVLTEPVQSRFPSRQPKEFVQELRKLTLEKNIVLIFDEMITGFRAGPRGAEAFYKVKPDLSTYGKVPGGGMPTGMISGLAKYMDFIDGGVWGFDDDSMPKLKRALMAGTHTQNSLKVTATLAACREIKRLCAAGAECDHLNCACDIAALNRRTKAMCDEMNAYFADKRVPLAFDYFSSLFRFQLLHDPYGIVRELLLILLKINGVETSVSGNSFLNLAHTDADTREVIDAFKRSVDTLLEHRFFHEAEPEPEAAHDAPAAPAPKPVAARPAAEGAHAHSEKLKALLMADLRNAGGREN